MGTGVAGEFDTGFRKGVKPEETNFTAITEELGAFFRIVLKITELLPDLLSKCRLIGHPEALRSVHL